MIGDPTLQFLSFEGCPDAEAVRANLVEAVERLGLTGGIQSVDLRKLPPDDPRLAGVPMSFHRMRSPTA